jgi:hypothetical protein
MTIIDSMALVPGMKVSTPLVSRAPDPLHGVGCSVYGATVRDKGRRE